MLLNRLIFLLCQPNPLNVRIYRITKDHKTDLETSVVGIQFVIAQQHFHNNKLKVSSQQYLLSFVLVIFVIK